jgi:hypothetical protein
MQMVETNEAAGYSSRGAARITPEASTAKTSTIEMVQRFIDRAAKL